MRKLILIIFCGVLGSQVNAQDVQFSQFYANSIYVNPAFTGGLHKERFTAHYRNQWTGLDANFTTYAFSGDYYFKKSRNGIGGYILRDVQGQNTLGSTEVAFTYAYELPITKTWSFRAGGQFAIVQRHLDYAQLRFPSQFTDDGIQSPTSVSHAIGNERVTYPDVSLGGLVYNRALWIGFSGHHLNTPSQSFIKDNTNLLQIRWAMIAGYKIVFNRMNNGLQKRDPEISLTPTAHYKIQGTSDQVDVGAYFHYYPMIFGLWYRGIPFKQLEKIQNNEAIIGMVGMRIKHWIVRYSYDFTLSTLSSANTGGAHEISISFRQFEKLRKKKKYQKSIPCPSF